MLVFRILVVPNWNILCLSNRCSNYKDSQRKKWHPQYTFTCNRYPVSVLRDLFLQLLSLPSWKRSFDLFKNSFFCLCHSGLHVEQVPVKFISRNYNSRILNIPVEYYQLTPHSIVQVNPNSIKQRLLNNQICGLFHQICYGQSFKDIHCFSLKSGFFVVF